MAYPSKIYIIYVIFMNDTNLLKFTKSQFKRFSKNFYSFFSIFSLQTLVQILFPPAMIFFWGIEKFGIWMFISAIPSTLAIFNINFSSASRSEMSINFENRNFLQVNKIFQNTFGLIIFNSLIFLIVWLLILSLDEMNFKILENSNYRDIKLIFFILAVSVHFLIINQIFYCGITYDGNVSSYNYNNLFFDTLSKICVPLSGFFTESLIYPAIIVSIVSFIKTIFLFVLYKNQNDKILNLSLSSFKLSISYKIFKLSMSYYLDNVSNLIKNNGSIIMLGLFFNPIIVGLISTMKTLFHFLPIRFLDILNNTIFYEFSKVFGAKKFNKLKKIFKMHLILSLFVLIFYLLISLMVGEFLYNFWTNNKFDFSFNLLFLIVAETFIFNIFNSIETLIKSINKFLESTIIKIIVSFLTLIITYIFLSKGYSFILYFVINLIASLTILIFISFFTTQTLKKYSE